MLGCKITVVLCILTINHGFAYRGKLTDFTVSKDGSMSDSSVEVDQTLLIEQMTQYNGMLKARVEELTQQLQESQKELMGLELEARDDMEEDDMEEEEQSEEEEEDEEAAAAVVEEEDEEENEEDEEEDGGSLLETSKDLTWYVVWWSRVIPSKKKIQALVAKQKAKGMPMSYKACEKKLNKVMRSDSKNLLDKLSGDGSTKITVSGETPVEAFQKWLDDNMSRMKKDGSFKPWMKKLKVYRVDGSSGTSPAIQKNNFQKLKKKGQMNGIKKADWSDVEYMMSNRKIKDQFYYPVRVWVK